MASLSTYPRPSSRSRPRRPATYADLAALPPNVVGELLDGFLYVHPRAVLPHAHVASALGSALGPPFHRGRGGPGGWALLDQPELHLVEDVVVPDLAGWRRERMADVTHAYSTLAPDWICEVLSESTEAVDRADKMPIFARDRVAHVWLVDPLLETVEVYRLEGDSYRLIATYRGAARVSIEPFEVVEIDLGALWSGGGR